MKALLPLLLLAAAPAFAAPPPCRQLDDQLTESLASARQRIDRDGLVRVAFDVDAKGRAQVVSVEGTRNYRTPVRIAVNSLDCQGGEPQRYVMEIRFADPRPALAAAPASAASATLAQAHNPR